MVRREVSGRRRFHLKALTFILALLLTLGLLEAGTYALVALQVLNTPSPTWGLAEFWEGNNPKYGVWHRLSASWRHQTPCFDVTYESNSVGARDVERSFDGPGERVVVLGDSFIEGWGLPLEARLTSLLQEHTGIEHLNFGMSHFGTYQELLVYRDLANRYTHDRVLIGIVPENDFFDLDYKLAKSASWYEYRYRPYLIGDYPNYAHFDFREPWWRRLPRRYSYAYNALASATAWLRGREPPPWRSPSIVLTHSFFYDVSDERFDLLVYSLEQIQAVAKGKKLAVVLFPVFFDFARFTQVRGEESKLSQRLKAFGNERGIQVVDLLPLMHRDDDPHWKDFFFGCDYHYNELANRIALESLIKALGPEFYPDGAGSSGSLSSAAPRTGLE